MKLSFKILTLCVSLSILLEVSVWASEKAEETQSPESSKKETPAKVKTATSKSEKMGAKAPVKAEKKVWRKFKNRKLAICNFENLTANIKAGQDLSRFCYTEFFNLSRKLKPHVKFLPFSVVDEFKIERVMMKNQWDDQVDVIEKGLNQLVDKLECGYLLFGTVSEYHYKRGLGEDPVVSLHLRLYETATEAVVWSGSMAKVGKFSWFHEDGLGRLGHDVCRKLIAKMYVDLFGGKR